MREMGLEGNVHNGLIFEIAHLQETNASVALQLAMEVDQSSILKEVIAKKEAELLALDRERILVEAKVAEREQEIVEITEKLSVIQQKHNEVCDEKRMLMLYVQDQAEKLLKTEASMQKMQHGHESVVEKLQLELGGHKATNDEWMSRWTECQEAHEKLLQAYHDLQETLANERATNESLRRLVDEKTRAMNESTEKVLHRRSTFTTDIFLRKILSTKKSQCSISYRIRAYFHILFLVITNLCIVGA
jgi:hypothetical protein